MEDRTTLMVVPHPIQGDYTVCENTEVCEKCGATINVGAWPFCPHPGGVSLVTEKTYPFKTKNFNGQEIEVTSRAHEAALMKEHGMVKRDDVAWIGKEYLGYNHKTGKQEYKEANGVGMPGCWI